MATAQTLLQWDDVQEYRKQSTQKELELRKAEKIARDLQKIPLRYQQYSWQEYTAQTPAQQKVKAVVMRYVETFTERLQEGSNLIFYGNPGAGKTLLSFLIYQELIKKDVSCHFESSLKFLRILQDKRFESDIAYSPLFNQYTNVPFLILDEITEGCGKGGFPSDWEKQLLHQIIDKRYQEMRCTLVISSRSLDEINARLETPIMDRLSHKGIFLNFNWSSYRQ